MRGAAEAVVDAALISNAMEENFPESLREELIQTVLLEPLVTKELFSGELLRIH